MSAPLEPAAQRASRLVLLAAVVLALGIAIWVNLHKSIWLDEVSTLNWTGTSLGYAWRMSEFREQKPPLYFILLDLWRTFGGGIEFARLFSTLCLVLTVYYLHRLSAVLGIGRGWASLAVVGALTPQLLWGGSEARVYALAALSVVAALYYFTRVHFTGTEHPWRDSAGFVLSAYAGLLTFYYTGFILAALFCAGLLGRDLRRLVWSGVALAVLLVPWLAWIWANLVVSYASYLHPVVLDGSSRPAWIASLLAWLGATAVNVVFRATTPVVHQRLVQAAMLGLLAALVVVRVWTGRPRWTRLESAFTLFTLAGFAILAALRVTNVTLVDERHWIVAVPGLIILPSLMASRIGSVRLRQVAGGALLVPFALATISYVRNGREQIDWRGPARVVASEEKAGEPIVLFDQDEHPFNYYYRGSNEVREVPYLPQPVTGEGDGIPAFSPAEMVRLRRVLALRDSVRGTFWLLEGKKRSKAVDVLSRQLGQPVEVLRTWDFHRTILHHVALRPAGGARTP